MFSGQQQPGVQAGLLTILKGPLEKQPVIFEANSLFVHTVHFQRGDLSYVLKEGDKVTVEVTEFSGGKERKRMFAKVSQFHYYLYKCLGFFEKICRHALFENQAHTTYFSSNYNGLVLKEFVENFVLSSHLSIPLL